MAAKGVSTDQQAEREDFVFDLLSRGHHKSAIKSKYREQFDCPSAKPTTARTIENYLSRARARALLLIATTRTEERALSLAFYDALARDEGATIAEKIRARERRDKLLGLDAPAQIQHDFSRLNDEELLQLAALTTKLASE